MRPVNLTISAFGPFAEKVTIPFYKIGKQGLYLITGVTGAGKTTIFDAISFALFGEASGNERDVSMLRSLYAKAETRTYVEMYFEHAGKEYFIHRNPSYARLKSRGEGFTEEVANAELKLPDGEGLITNLKAVNAKIKDILGIDKKQFSQIAMIAQGDFLKVLTSSTKERQEIFRKVFATDNFLKLQDAISKDVREIKNKYSQSLNSIKNMLQDTICNEDSEYFKSLKNLCEKDSPSTSEIMDLLANIILENEKRKNELEKEIVLTDKKLEVINSDLGKIEACEKAKAAYEKANSELSDKQKELIPEKDFRLKQKELQNSKEDFNKNINYLNLELPKYSKLDSINSEIFKLSENLELSKQNLYSKTNEVKEKEKSLESLKSENEKLQKSGENLESLKSEYKKTEEQLSELYKLSQSYKEYFVENDKFEKSCALLDKYIKDWELKNNEYVKLYKRFLMEQSGILAENLEEGEKCPVCGSIHHPCLAVKSKDAPSEQDVNNAKAAAENLQMRINKGNAYCHRSKGIVETKKLGIDRDILKIFGKSIELSCFMEKTEGKKEFLEVKKTKIGESIKIEEKNIKRRNLLKDLIPKEEILLTELREGESGMHNLEIKIKTLSIGIQEKTLNKKDLEKTLRYKSFIEAENNKRAFEKQRDSLQEIIDENERKQSEIRSSVESLKGQIKSFEAQARDLCEVNKEEKERFKANLIFHKQNLSKDKEEIIVIQNRNNDIKTNIEKTVRQMLGLSEEYSWKSSLSDTVSGSISGQDKISLETYVQSAYFDCIIMHSNNRLLKMSNGQYELVRKKVADNQRSQTGLDLDVRDHYNESIRDVKSLSGGEKFMASLSLAFGLSDEIQQNAGGVQFDTIFVDEGFGSLSQGNALDRVMSVLSEISKGNKLVGIISHVGELQKIDKQVIVLKQPNGGSTLKLAI